MAGPVYGYDHAFAAMCIIEEIVDPNLAGTPWQDYRDKWGINGIRDVVLTKLAGPCDDAWNRANARYEEQFNTWQATHQDDPARVTQPSEPGSFDYEFVPFWLRNCVDWNDEHPRVKGSADGISQ